MVTVTIALSKKEPGAPDPKVLRQALFSWAFNPATRDIAPQPHIAAALGYSVELGHLGSNPVGRIQWTPRRRGERGPPGRRQPRPG